MVSHLTAEATSSDPASLGGVAASLAHYEPA